MFFAIWLGRPKKRKAMLNNIVSKPGISDTLGRCTIVLLEDCFSLGNCSGIIVFSLNFVKIRGFVFWSILLSAISRISQYGYVYESTFGRTIRRVHPHEPLYAEH